MLPEGPVVQLSAYEDLAGIQERVTRAAGSAAADRATDRMLDGIDLLGANPYLGPLHHDKFLSRRGYRKLVLGQYVVVYRVEEDRAVVLRVFHGAGDYARHMEE